MLRPVSIPQRRLPGSHIRALWQRRIDAGERDELLTLSCSRGLIWRVASDNVNCMSTSQIPPPPISYCVDKMPKVEKRLERLTQLHVIIICGWLSAQLIEFEHFIRLIVVPLYPLPAWRVPKGPHAGEPGWRC